MMTDLQKPLGLSFFLLISPATMRTAAGRLFVDVTQMLASPASRATVLDALYKSDPRIKDALTTVLDRGNFIKLLPDDSNKVNPTPVALMAGPPPRLITTRRLLRNWRANSEAAVSTLKENIETKSGPALFDFIREHIQELKTVLFDRRSLGVLMAGINASAWVNEKMEEWLGEKKAADYPCPVCAQ